MNDEVKAIIEKTKEVKDLLKGFAVKDEAVEYLAKETKISKDECSTAYDIIMKLPD